MNKSKGGRKKGAGHYNTVWKENGRVVKKNKKIQEQGENENRRGAEEQAITTISVPFKKLSSKAVWCWNEEESSQEAAGKLA